MENERKDENLTQEQENAEKQTPPAYTPRPLWQVIGAWVLLIVFIGLVVSGYVQLFGGAG